MLSYCRLKMADAGYLQNLRDEAKCRKYEKTVISQTEAIFRRPVNIQRQLNDHFRIEFPLRPTPAQFREFYTATRERYRAICFMSVPGVLYDGTPVQIDLNAIMRYKRLMRSVVKFLPTVCSYL